MTICTTYYFVQLSPNTLVAFDVVVESPINKNTHGRINGLRNLILSYNIGLFRMLNDANARAVYKVKVCKCVCVRMYILYMYIYKRPFPTLCHVNDVYVEIWYPYNLFYYIRILFVQKTYLKMNQSSILKSLYALTRSVSSLYRSKITSNILFFSMPTAKIKRCI